ILPAPFVFVLTSWLTHRAHAEKPPAVPVRHDQGDAASPADQANRKYVDRVGSLVKPHGNEWRWLQIPWEPVPLKGFQRAGQEGKPVVSYGRYAGVPFGAG